MFIVLTLATTSNLPSPQLSPLRCIFFPKLLIIPFFTTWIVSHCSHVSISTFNYQTIHCSSSLIATSGAKGQSIAITRIQLHVQSPNSHSCLFSKHITQHTPRFLSTSTTLLPFSYPFPHNSQNHASCKASLSSSSIMWCYLPPSITLPKTVNKLASHPNTTYNNNHTTSSHCPHKIPFMTITKLGKKTTTHHNFFGCNRKLTTTC